MSKSSGPSCHAEGATEPHDKFVVALVGSPNSGKTTLFNWLTGSRFKTVNYPGSTVEHSVGTTNERYGVPITVMDTPGTYSLDPKSPDERVTFEAIFRHKNFGSARLVVSIADATHLRRHLLLTRQLIASGFPLILAITMSDLLREQAQEIRVEELSRELGIPVVLLDGRLGMGVPELVESIRKRLQELESGRRRAPEFDLMAARADRIESLMKENSEIVKRVVCPLPLKQENKVQTARERSRKLDAFFLHPVWGLVFFVFLMTALFSSIFWLASPMMKGVDFGFTFLGHHLLALSPDNLLLQFISNGVIASVSAVLVFAPQIFILFIGIILLEDSGYLARSATLMDRPLTWIGLGGRSFVPLLSGYACAVPAMMAARTINSPKERWLTLFILPLMSCSARLPVYALLLSFLFMGQPAWKAGLMLTGIYFTSLFLGGLAAWLAGRFVRFDEKSFFMLELPVYRRPKTALVLRQASARTASYIRRAGPMIFTFALIIWMATTFPNYNASSAHERLRSSYAAQLGRVIEPVFRPMGGDWRTGVGLISAFAAREVFVSSLAVVFQVADGQSTDSGEDSESLMQQTLLRRMQEAKADTGYPLFTTASVLGLIVFFMIALQCLSTVTMSMRETGNWRFAMIQLVVFNCVGYALAVALVQSLRAAGIA